MQVSIAILFLTVSGFVAGDVLHAEQAANSKEARKDKILFLGNSITLHPPAEPIGWTGNWGMAASAQQKDCVHLVVQSLSEPTSNQPTISNQPSS